jgi:hypothetical protein
LGFNKNCCCATNVAHFETVPRTGVDEDLAAPYKKAVELATRLSKFFVPGLWFSRIFANSLTAVTGGLGT